MCLILVGKPEAILELNLKQAWASNSDGSGIIVCSNPALMVKGIMNFKTLKKTIKAVKVEHPGVDIAVHFRFATHGSKSEENTHPFPAGDGWMLMHNGVFHSLGSRGYGGDSKSDSGELAEILSYLPPALKITATRQIVGYTNRVLLVAQDGSWDTFGSSWSEHKGVKMSNELLKPYTGYQQYGSYRHVYKGGEWVVGGPTAAATPTVTVADTIQTPASTPCPRPAAKEVVRGQDDDNLELWEDYCRTRRTVEAANDNDLYVKGRGNSRRTQRSMGRVKRKDNRWQEWWGID